MPIPLIIKVLASLGVIILLSKWIKHLHIPVIAGALFLGLTCGHGIPKIISIAFERVISLNNIFMISVVVMIVWLSSQMAEAGIMKELVIRVRARVSQRIAMGLLPALIGLLPMPGGALFSAPLVDDCDHTKDVDSLLKTRINYWFRHIWEYWWPLYPGVLLAMEITGIDILKFIMYLFPMSLIAVLVGWYFLLRPVKTPPVDDNIKAENKKSIFPLLMPIYLIIGIYALIRNFAPGLASLNKYIPMFLGVVGAITYLEFYRPLPSGTWTKIIWSKRVWTLALLVVLVRVYGAFMEAELPNGNSLVSQLQAEMEHFHIAPILVIILIPFICGMTTGLAIGFVGASFPVVMAMAGQNPSLSQLIPIISLAYGSGYLGMLLSPVHVCLIVTNQHFQTRLYDSIKHLIIPAVIMFLLFLAYYFTLDAVL